MKSANEWYKEGIFEMLGNTERKPGSPKDIVSKEETLQRKDGKLLVDGEVRALLHSCKKPGSPKDIAFKEETLQRKDD
eukprot:8980453-Ditylum_brightwellii.AAC.1